MPLPTRLATLLMALAACDGGGASRSSDTSDAADAHLDATSPALGVNAVTPWVVDPLGGSRLVVSGSGFSAGDPPVVEIGGVAAPAVTVVSDGELRLVSAPVPTGEGHDLVVRRGAARVTLADAITSWSPADIPGARLFDASHGATTEGPRTHYEWQRLTPDIGASWRARDGNTTTWLPATGRFWMVGGWNGLPVPDGFSTIPEGVQPYENTTNEVWSSPDGATWTLELAHGHPQFERRHVHNMVLWRDRLWMIGGDHHQGRYNHDVASSADGVTWQVVLGPGTIPLRAPPWTPRAMQVSGVFEDALWTAGGQDQVGDPDAYVHHNDVWRSEDGVDWIEVAPDAPASDTRWAGCGALDGLVAFRGRMWLVGCARERSDAVGHTTIAQVWSTTDGRAWRRHPTPPWAGKIWHNVVVWDDRLWILFGFTYGDPTNGWPVGNATEVWSSEDGEAWTALHPDTPVPGSHAQGVAVTDGFLLLAGGNYTFGVGDGLHPPGQPGFARPSGEFDRSTWRLVPQRGEAVARWVDRGADGLVVSAAGDARPTLVPDAFGPGAPGLHLDGASSYMALEPGEVDAQAAGRSVFWVARAPWVPTTPGWEPLYNPAGTIVGGAIGDGFPQASAGLTHGRVAYTNREDGLDALGSPRWITLTGGEALQRDVGALHLAGVTHAPGGEVRLFVDGAQVGEGRAHFGAERGWSRIGAGLDGAGEGPANRFGGTLGAVIILPGAADDETVARLHAWARGRFGSP
ncbi:MAG: IPT/TIG domain-containing protein [Deltaproteobacteria bacterium]|nr:IPT/TIG domain-containing protein [Deltaproteobacteria bacterium]